MINTSCKECVFSTKKYNKQVGCKLDKLERFKELKCAKEEENHYIIEGRICIFCRDLEWAKKQKTADLEEAILVETAIKHTYVILFNDNDNLEDLTNLCDNIFEEGRAFQVIVVNNKSPKLGPKIKDILERLGLPHYQLVTIFGKSQDGSKYNNDELMEYYLSKVKGGFFTILTLPTNISHNFIDKLEENLNIRLDRFVAVLGEDLNKSTYQTYLAKTLKGNLPYIFPDPAKEDEHIIISLLNDKIQHVSKQESTESMIKNISEVFGA